MTMPNSEKENAKPPCDRTGLLAPSDPDDRRSMRKGYVCR